MVDTYLADELKAVAVNPGPGFNPARMAFLGTSIVNHANGAVISSGNLSNIFSSSRSWLAWLEIFSFGAIRNRNWYDPTVYTGWEPSGTPGATRGFSGSNLGVSGQTGQQIKDRVFGTNGVTHTIWDYYFTHIFVDQGTNDIASLTKESILQTRIETILEIIRRGRFVFCLPIRLRSNAQWTQALRQKAAWVNSKLRDFCAGRTQILFLDWNRPLIDGMSATGDTRVGVQAAQNAFLDDGIHDAPQGGAAIAWWMWHGEIWVNGVAVKDWSGLKIFFPQYSMAEYSNDQIFNTDNPRGNLFTNGSMLGTSSSNLSNGATGAVPPLMGMQRSSGTGSTTVVGSIAARPDGLGNQSVMTFTTGGSAIETFYLRTAPSTISVAGQEGAWIESSLDLDVSAYTQWFGFQLYTRDDAATTRISYGAKAYNDGTNDWPMPSFPWTGRIFSPALQLRASPAATTITPRLEILIKPGGTGTPVVKASQYFIGAVDDPASILAAA